MAKNKTPCVDDYQLLKDAYYGSGGFADGSYLVQHKRERVDKYTTRRALSYYLNYVAPCVNSHVDPIFREEISRDWSGGAHKLFEAFVKDTDMNGTDIQEMAKRAALGAKLYGVNFMVMDNLSDQPDTVEKALQQRAFPYCYTVEPSRVVDYETDAYGRLTSFSYTEPVPDDEKTETHRIDGKDEYNIRTWTTTGWKLTNGDGSKVLGSGEHNLGRVPVVIWRSRDMDRQIIQPSEFLSIVKTNNHIFQLCSWLSEILQNQAFSILTYPVESISGEKSNLIIGTDNALAFPADASNTPAFIAPSADPATMITNQIDRLIQEIYRMANLTLVTGVQKQQSGVAKAWDFERTNQTLSNFASNCQSSEEDMGALFALWVGSDLTYTVAYPTDFALLDVADELTNAEMAVSLQLGSTFLQEVAKKIIDAYLPGLDPEIYDKIMQEIAANGMDVLQSQLAGYQQPPAGDVTPNG